MNRGVADLRLIERWDREQREVFSNRDLQIAVLRKRLSEVRSQIPKLRRRQSMSFLELADELRQEALVVTQKRLSDGLSGLLPNEEIAGLAPRVKAALNTLAEQIERA